MRLLSFIFLLSIGSQVYAEAFYTTPSEVKSISLGHDGLRVKVNAMEDSKQTCTHDDWYILGASSDYFDPAYSTLLASKMSSTKINFQINGCASYGGNRTYPKITQVYFCDTKLCS